MSDSELTPESREIFDLLEGLEPGASCILEARDRIVVIVERLVRERGEFLSANYTRTPWKCDTPDREMIVRVTDKYDRELLACEATIGAHIVKCVNAMASKHRKTRQGRQS